MSVWRKRIRRIDRSSRDSRGFTLVELLLVIFLIGVMTATLGLSQGRFLSGFRLSSAARQVMTDLRLARAKAVSQSAAFRVTFTAGSGSYFVERWNDDPLVMDWQHYALYGRGDGAIVGGATPVLVSLPSGTRALDSGTVGFRPRGTSDGIAAVRVGHEAISTVRRIQVSLSGLIAIDP